MRAEKQPAFGLACEPVTDDDKKRGEATEDLEREASKGSNRLFLSPLRPAFGRSLASNVLSFFLHLNAAEKQRVGAHLRGEEGGRIVKHGGRTKGRGKRERDRRRRQLRKKRKTTPLGLAFVD